VQHSGFDLDFSLHSYTDLDLDLVSHSGADWVTWPVTRRVVFRFVRFAFWNVLEHFPCARVCERVPTVSASIRIRYGGHLLYITALVTRNRKQ